MFNKKILIVILSLVSLTTTFGLVAFSYAWYTMEQSEQLDFHLPADGFLIIEFNEEVDYSDTVITPAVAMVDAVRNGEYMDVLRAYNVEDPTPSFIETVAEAGTYAAVLQYYNAEENITGNEIVIIVEAVATLPDETEVPINLDREISIVISVLVEDSLGVAEDVTISPLASGEAFSVPSKSIITITLVAYIKLPDELCDPALNEGVLTFLVTVTSNSVEP